MATLKEKLQADLDAARKQVTDLEQKMATLPPEIETIGEEVWAKIKSFLGITE